eukprot:587526-Karenia_brevis.AAC.1
MAYFWGSPGDGSEPQQPYGPEVFDCVPRNFLERFIEHYFGRLRKYFTSAAREFARHSTTAKTADAATQPDGKKIWHKTMHTALEVAATLFSKVCKSKTALEAKGLVTGAGVQM